MTSHSLTHIVVYVPTLASVWSLLSRVIVVKPSGSGIEVWKLNGTTLELEQKLCSFLGVTVGHLQ